MGIIGTKQGHSDTEKTRVSTFKESVRHLKPREAVSTITSAFRNLKDRFYHNPAQEVATQKKEEAQDQNTTPAIRTIGYYLEHPDEIPKAKTEEVVKPSALAVKNAWFTFNHVKFKTTGAFQERLERVAAINRAVDGTRASREGLLESVQSNHSEREVVKVALEMLGEMATVQHLENIMKAYESPRHNSSEDRIRAVESIVLQILTPLRMSS